MSNATFINAVMNVRIEQGVFHFTLGEMVPSQSGKSEFIPAFRGVIPEGDAAQLFEYLKQKAEAYKTHGVTGLANQEQSTEIESVMFNSETESSDPTDLPSEDVVRKRKIATSDGEPHTK